MNLWGEIMPFENKESDFVPQITRVPPASSKGAMMRSFCRRRIRTQGRA